MKNWNRRKLLNWIVGSAYAAALPIAIPAAGLVSYLAFDNRRFRFGATKPVYKISISLPEGQSAAEYLANLPTWLNTASYDELKAQYERAGRITATKKKTVGREFVVEIEFRSNRDLISFEREIMVQGLSKVEVRRQLGYFVREEMVIGLG